MHVAAVHMPETNKEHDDLWMANARLLAAAPDLLDALKALLARANKELADPEDVNEAWLAEKAIGKATGETP